jgi:hypothetical protein
MGDSHKYVVEAKMGSIKPTIIRKKGRMNKRDMKKPMLICKTMY